MNREMVVVPEKKKKIEMIKKKYKNMSMSDDIAKKISRLDVANTILKSATAVVGVVTVIDLFVPDPVLGLDELALGSITGLLGYASSVVDNKIDALANSEDISVEMSEVAKLSEQLTNAAANVKRSRGK